MPGKSEAQLGTIVDRSTSGGRPAVKTSDGQWWVMGDDGLFVPMNTASSATPGTMSTQDLINSITQGLAPFFEETSGFSREELDEQARQFDEELAYKREQWEREGVPYLEIERRLVELKEQELQHTIEMGRAELGLQWLTTAAGLGGPANAFQQADFMRGAQGRPDVPVFLQALSEGASMPAFVQPGTAPQPMSMDSLMQDLTGGQMGTTQQVAPGVTVNAGAATPPSGPNAFRFGVHNEQSNVAPDHERALEYKARFQAAYPQLYDAGRFDDWLRGGESLVGAAQKVAAELASQTQAPQPAAAPPAPVTPTTFATEQNLSDFGGGIVSRNGNTVTLANGQTATQSVPGGDWVLQGGATPSAPAATIGTGTDTDAALEMVQRLAQEGAHKMAPGSLERLSSYELDILGSGFKEAGVDWGDWLQSYQRSRPAQTASRGTKLGYAV